MKKILIIAAMLTFLIGASACTDLLYVGTPDVGPEGIKKPDPTYTFNHPCAYVSASNIKKAQESVAAEDPTPAGCSCATVRMQPPLTRLRPWKQ